MTNTELKALVQQCAKTVNTIDSDWLTRGAVKEIKFNSRLTRALGRCTRRDKKFILEFSTKYFTCDSTTEEEKISVIYHELVHCIKGCYNHGETFKLIGRKIERETGVPNIADRVRETGDYKKNTAKYKTTCDSCGRVGYRNRSMGKKSSTTHYSLFYSCGRCGESTLMETPNK